MSAAEVKPIQVIKFDEFNKDGRVDGLYYSDGETTSDGEKNVYLGVPVEYKNDDYKPSMFSEDNTGSKSITFTGLKKVKYEFFVRHFGDVESGNFIQLLKAAFPFRDKETVDRHVWVILNAKDIKEAKAAFISKLSDVKLDDEKTKSNYNIARDNHPENRQHIRRTNRQKEASEESDRNKIIKDKRIKEITDLQRAAGNKEDARIKSNTSGRVLTIDKITVDDVLTCKSLFICEEFDETKRSTYGTEFAQFSISTNSRHRSATATYQGLTYRMVARKSTFFDVEEIKQATQAAQKKDLLKKIMSEPFNDYASTKVYVWFVLDAETASNAKDAFLKDLAVSTSASLVTGQDDTTPAQFKFGYIVPENMTEYDDGARGSGLTSILKNYISTIDAWGYIIMSIKRAFPSPPPIEEGKEAVVKYLDEIKPDDVKSAASIFVCQIDANLLDSIKKSFLKKPEFYEKLMFEITNPQFSNREFVVRNSVFSDEDTLELYNNVQVANKKPVLTRESADYFEKVVLDPYGDPTVSSYSSFLVWFILNARSLKDAVAAIQKRFNLTPIEGSTDSYETDLAIYSKQYNRPEAEEYCRQPITNEFNRANPIVYVPPRRHNNYDNYDDSAQPPSVKVNASNQPQKPQKPTVDPSQQPQKIRPPHPFAKGGNRRRSTRRKYKKSVSRAKSAKRVKSAKRSFSASRKYRNRK